MRYYTDRVIVCQPMCNHVIVISIIAERLSARLMIADQAVLWCICIYVCNAYAHAVAIRVIRVPGGSGHLCA